MYVGGYEGNEEGSEIPTLFVAACARGGDRRSGVIPCCRVRSVSQVVVSRAVKWKKKRRTRAVKRSSWTVCACLRLSGGQSGCSTSSTSRTSRTRVRDWQYEQKNDHWTTSSRPPCLRRLNPQTRSFDSLNRSRTTTRPMPLLHSSNPLTRIERMESRCGRPSLFPCRPARERPSVSCIA